MQNRENWINKLLIKKNEIPRYYIYLFARSITNDYVYIDDLEEYENFKSVMPALTTATDYAINNNLSHNNQNTGLNNKKFVSTYLRDLRDGSYSNIDINTIDHFGSQRAEVRNSNKVGISPCIKIKIDDEIISQNNIKEAKSYYSIEKNYDYLDVNKAYYTLKLGEYPQTTVNKDLNITLENLYNYGDIKNKLHPTGRWFTVNGNMLWKNFSPKHNPEFIYNEERYIRLSEQPIGSVSDDEELRDKNWVKVEPIKFVIRNWKDLPKSINPEGAGTSEHFDLKTEHAILSGIPYYPNLSEHFGGLWQNSSIRGFLNGINVNNVKTNANPELTTTKGGNFEGENNFLNEALNLTREPVYEYTFSNDIDEIIDRALEGNVLLKKVSIPVNINKIGKDVFKGIKFNYFYVEKDSNYRILSYEKPQNLENLITLIDLKHFHEGVMGFDYNILFNDNVAVISEIVSKFHKVNTKIHYAYLNELQKTNNLEKFNVDLNLTFIKKMMNIYNGQFHSCVTDAQINSFYKFITALGCFSGLSITDRNFNNKNIIVAQKANHLLERILGNRHLFMGDLTQMFSGLNVKTFPNERLINFLSYQSQDKSFANLDLILKLEIECPGLFTKVVNHFDNLKDFKMGVDERGAPKKRNWEETLRRFYKGQYYAKVEPQNEDLARELGQAGVQEYYYRAAVENRSKAKARNIPKHILGKPLSEFKEMKVLSEIKQLQNNIENEIVKSGELINKHYKNRFKYEMLDKSAAENFIIGVYVDSCATIQSTFYGRQIVDATILSPDVQNMVVRKNGVIIAKGAMYVNKELGYIVFNDFEINDEYRKRQYYENKAADFDPKCKEELERKEIFNAFKRGIKAFVREYDKQHPDKPIQKVNVGSASNKLRYQVHQLEREENRLTVPSNYHFEDAEYEQYKIYEKMQ